MKILMRVGCSIYSASLKDTNFETDKDLLKFQGMIGFNFKKLESRKKKRQSCLNSLRQARTLCIETYLS